MKLDCVRRLLAGLFLSIFATIAPALADDSNSTLPGGVTYRPPALHLAGPLQPHAVSVPTVTRIVMYMLQAIDGAESARALRTSGRREENPMMRPFSHGGALTMDLGFAMGDIVREFTLRRSSEAVQASADALQAASNIDGILTTRAASR